MRPRCAELSFAPNQPRGIHFRNEEEILSGSGSRSGIRVERALPAKLDLAEQYARPYRFRGYSILSRTAVSIVRGH